MAKIISVWDVEPRAFPVRPYITPEAIDVVAAAVRKSRGTYTDRLRAERQLLRDVLYAIEQGAVEDLTLCAFVALQTDKADLRRRRKAGL